MSFSSTSPDAPFSIGLTGGIGSGKTTIANLFGALGAAVIDTDVIARQLSVPGGIAIAAIRAQFGDAFIDAEGGMDRARMRAHVFTDATARKRLENILHPLIRDAAAQAVSAARGDYPIFVVPLLVESQQWRQYVSRILLADCSEEQQIARVMQRDTMSRAQVEAIMAAQATRAQRLAVADDVIENEFDTAALLPRIAALHACYLSLAKTNSGEHL
ncbi:MAG: dephospho-CoA kinase [Herbaspirillum sp.]